MTSIARLAYETRAERYWHARHPLAEAFLRLMARKRSNLSVAADVTTKAALLSLADTVGPYICLLKTHIDIIEDFDQDLATQLVRLAKKHDFMIFEDRKFADIGNTVKHQYSRGVYRIANWSHITNAHPVPGDGIVRGLREVGLVDTSIRRKPRSKDSDDAVWLDMPRGLLLLAEMSSQGSLAVGQYTDKCVEMAQAHPDFVIGFVASRRLTADDASAADALDFITMSPGVQMAAAGDALGQQYRTPEVVIERDLSDVIIVGRGIYEAPEPAAAARAYRDLGWLAYQRRVGTALPPGSPRK